MKRTVTEAIKLATDTINYYLVDPTRQAYDVGAYKCYYLMPDGRKCAVGKHIDSRLKEPFKCDGDVTKLDEAFGLDNILKKGSRGFTVKFWDRLQDIHDDSLPNIDRTVDKLKSLVKDIKNFPDDYIA